MTDEFVENNKIFELNGTINRRNYITNFFIAELVESLIFTTPFFMLFFIKPDLMNGFLKYALQHGGASPKWMIIWGFVATLVSLGLMYPSIVKRVRDITGKVDNYGIVFGILAIKLLMFLPAPMIVQQVFSGLSLFTTLCLWMMKGKITGEKPADELIKFNWGAMFGTWIWGLGNKCYITLLAIPLFFTAGIFPFMIICGLKGNEWARKNSDKPIEEFHKSQSTQAVIYSAIFPIIFLVFSFGSLVVGSVATAGYLKSHPNAIHKLDDYLLNFIKMSVEARYSNIEFTEDEYKFYLDPVMWKKLPKSGKLNLFTVTERYVVMSLYDDYFQTKQDPSIYGGDFNKIKIYSTFNNELLAEYYFDVEEYKTLTDKFMKREIPVDEYAKAIQKGYKFNDNPTLP